MLLGVLTAPTSVLVRMGRVAIKQLELVTVSLGIMVRIVTWTVPLDAHLVLGVIK